MMTKRNLVSEQQRDSKKENKQLNMYLVNSLLQISETMYFIEGYNLCTININSLL